MWKGKEMELASYVAEYLKKLQQCLDHMDLQALEKVVEVLARAWDEGRKIFVFGNGGSAATASHFVNDLNKLASMGNEKKFKAIALTDNVPLMTAWANDEDYAEIFAQQLDNLLNQGDIVIGISGSGNSENVIRALRLASERGGITIGFLGFDGGRMKDLVDYFIWFQEHHYGRVEDAHAIVCHIIANFLRKACQGKRHRESAPGQVS